MYMSLRVGMKYLILFLFVLIYLAVGRRIDNWKARCLSSSKTEEWDQKDAKLYSFLTESIPEALEHTGEHAFNEHLKGVQIVLRLWGADEQLCNAGLFHSIYGTEGFQGYRFPITRRPAIRRLIGAKAERLVWIFCVLDRQTLDKTLCNTMIAPPITLFARYELGRFPIVIETREEYLDLLELTLSDWLEQVEGAASKENLLFEWKEGEAWSYRRNAYKRMLDILLEHRGERLMIAKEMFEDIYEAEAYDTRNSVQELTPPMSQAARDARDAIASIGL